MPQEEIEFIIRPDGTVEETTRGLKGQACERVTARLEQTLGEVFSREATAERYEAEPRSGSTATQSDAGI